MQLEANLASPRSREKEGKERFRLEEKDEWIGSRARHRQSKRKPFNFNLFFSAFIQLNFLIFLPHSPQAHFNQSVSRSRSKGPAEKRMRMESTARSRSRSMSRPPRNEMGIKDAQVTDVITRESWCAKTKHSFELFFCYITLRWNRNWPTWRPKHTRRE